MHLQYDSNRVAQIPAFYTGSLSASSLLPKSFTIKKGEVEAWYSQIHFNNPQLFPILMDFSNVCNRVRVVSQETEIWIMYFYSKELIFRTHNNASPSVTKYVLSCVQFDR